MPKPQTRTCLLCEEPDTNIHRVDEQFICQSCLERGQVGRDTTTRAARALRIARTEQGTANLCRARGDDASADSHEFSSGTYAARAAKLLMPGLEHTMAMGEAIPIKDSRLADTLKVPNVAGLDASAHRLELLGHLGLNCTALALDAADTIGAENSLEKMLAHQLATAHKVALDVTAQGALQRNSVEKARLLHLAGRMMETFQHGLLTLQRLRNSDRHHVALTVADGGQAVVIVGIYEGK